MKKIISLLLVVLMLVSVLPVGFMGFAEEESDIAPVLRVQADNTPGQPVYLEYEQVSAALGKNAWIALRKSGDNVRDYVAYVYLTDASGNLKPGIGESGSLEILGDGWVGRYADSYDTLPEGAYDVSIFLNNSYDEGIGEVVTFYVGNKIEVDKTEYRIGEDILVTATELSSSLSGGWITLLEASSDLSIQGMAYKYVDSLTEGVPVKLTDFTRQRWTGDTLPAGSYKLVLFTSQKKVAGTIRYFTVYPMDVETDAVSYSEGKNITVSFEGLNTSLGSCWLALYKKGDSPEARNQSVWWTWLVNNGAAQQPHEAGAGTIALPANYTPGDYYFVVVNSAYKRLSPEYAITITEKQDPVTMIQPELTNSISLHYTAELDLSPADVVYMRFTMNGNCVDVTGTEQDGRLVFSYTDILPQNMGDTILSELYVGEEIVSTREYSMRQYCLNMLAKTTGNTETDKAFRALLVAMLNYGTEAQKYFDPETAVEDYINTGVEQSDLSSFSYDVQDAQSALSLDMTANQGDYVWKAATLGLYDELKLRIRFYAADITGLSIVADGVTYTDFVRAGGVHEYFVYVPVYASNFSNGIEMTFYKEGELGTTLTYSVNSFVYYVVNENLNDALDVVSAIYQYGCAAERYLQEITVRR